MCSYMLIINPADPWFSTCAAQPVSAQYVFIKCPVLYVVTLPTAACHSVCLTLCHLLFIPGTTPLFRKPPLFNLTALASPTSSCSQIFSVVFVKVEL